MMVTSCPALVSMSATRAPTRPQPMMMMNVFDLPVRYRCSPPAERAGSYGSASALSLSKPVVGMAATPDGRGYWLVASDGGVFTFGDAGFFGSAASLHLNKPIVGMAGG